ncbi:MAG: response regulator [Desulfovibrio sp.]|jgi:putative two-component system response regulator|nr:response regulator [Desulfovibrio sp.]
MQAGERPVIVAVDDEAMILHNLAEMLKNDYSVRPFTSAETALNFLTRGEQQADLILLDFHMPGMSGFEFFKILKLSPRTSGIPVIFLTGSFGGESEALELGAADFIAKPVTPRVLLLRIRHQLELQYHRRRLQGMVDDKTRILDLTISKLRDRESVILNILARMTDLRDHETGGHIERTTGFVRIIVEHIFREPSEGYTLTRSEADNIITSAKLHDLGKIAMPDSVLLKKDRLSRDEFSIIKMHPVHGERFLEFFIRQMDDPFLNTARDIAYAHHERWDGTGYPLGLAGALIPLSARIVAIADVYDALISERPYKIAYSHAQSMSMISEESGRHFDPYLVRVFALHDAEIGVIAGSIAGKEALSSASDPA